MPLLLYALNLKIDICAQDLKLNTWSPWMHHALRPFTQGVILPFLWPLAKSQPLLNFYPMSCRELQELRHLSPVIPATACLWRGSEESEGRGEDWSKGVQLEGPELLPQHGVNVRGPMKDGKKQPWARAASTLSIPGAIITHSIV